MMTGPWKCGAGEGVVVSIQGRHVCQTPHSHPLGQEPGGEQSPLPTTLTMAAVARYLLPSPKTHLSEAPTMCQA